jgi:hypothetical protein
MEKGQEGKERMVDIRGADVRVMKVEAQFHQWTSSGMD